MKITGQIVDIHNKTIFGGFVEFENGIITRIGKLENTIGNFILPGMIDAHVHIESSMVTPSQFALTAVRHGTVAVVSDPHEIANVMGLEGVEYMIKDAAGVPVKFLFGAPSCVPATPFETSGATVSSEEIKKLLENDSVGYLAEMMNFPGVLFDDPEVMAKIEAAKKAGKCIDGHAPGLTGEQLRKYVSAGISTDHECSTLDEALEKISLGMHILIREGSAAKNLDALKTLINSHTESVMLCSDDLHPEMLEKGHINLLVARLVSEGFDIFNVLNAACGNPVRHYGLDTGLLREGDFADFIVTGDLHKMNILQTWIKGRCVFSEGITSFKATDSLLLNRFNASPLKEIDVKVKRTGRQFKVIKAFNGELLTDCFLHDAGENEFVECNTSDDIIKIAVKDRYMDSVPSVAFINGFGIKNGAFATSVAHDSHNVIGIGTNDSLLVEAMNLVISQKGGMAVVCNERNAVLPLPVAGIMSDKDVATVAQGYEKLSGMVKDMGCLMDAPFMTLSFMALLVIPKLKIGDKGLFDVTTFKPSDLFND